MTRRLLLLLAIVCPAATPYIVHRTSSGATITRPDFSSVQFLLNQDFVPGFTNNDGTVVVTPDSDVMGALNAAIATWNSIPTTAAQFAPLQTTPAGNNNRDGRNVIVMADSPAIRSILGPTLTALTALTVSGTVILESDIIFNPGLTFSSTGAPNTYDLQAVFTKQLGNALGISNSGVIGSALFVFSSASDSTKENLSPDDIAGVSGLYPASGDPTYGTLTGTLTLNGAPLRNVLISAVDPASGTALATLTKPTDGSWSIATPPGNYLIYAQPLNPFDLGQAIAAEFVGLGGSDVIDTKFQPGFFGGNGSGTTISVTAGASSDASFSPSPASDGPALSLLTCNAVAAGGFPTTFRLTPATSPVVSGRSYDLVISGSGFDSTLSDANILLLGPVSLRPGTVKLDKTSPLNVNDVPYPFARMTIDVPAASTQSYGTLIISNSAGFVSYTGGIVIKPQ